MLKRVARSLSSSRVVEQARKRWNAVAGKEAELGGLGLHRIRMGGVRGNPTLKKGTRGVFTRRNEVVYNHMRLGQPVILSESEGDCRSIRKVWSCACQGVGKWGEGVKHILFECPEHEEERTRMQKCVEQKEEEEKRAVLEKGRIWRGGSWGKLSLLDRHPNAAMGFIADALGCGYGTTKEENERVGGKKGAGKGSGKGKGYGKGARWSAML